MSRVPPRVVHCSTLGLGSERHIEVFVLFQLFTLSWEPASALKTMVLPYSSSRALAQVYATEQFSNTCGLN